MEKIKDLLYDLSDVFLSIIIIVLIFGVVSWKISDVMKVPGVSVAQSENTYTSITDEVADDNKIEVITFEPVDDSTDETTINDDNASTDDVAVDTSTTANDAKPVPTKKTFTINIEIPSGTTGFGISKILKSNGLITDTNEFLQLATKLELVNKMRSGTYELSSDMNMEEMIRKLTGR
jgi:exopolysaccharide biosynthesis protein